MNNSTRPFTQSDEPAIHFRNAPLAMVLTQIKWPSLGALQGEEFTKRAQRLGAKLSDSYPLAHEVPEISVVFDQNGVQESQGSSMFHWTDAAGEWTVSFAQNFLAVQTVRYESFVEFRARVDEVLAVLDEVVKIPVVERLGFRYSNRIQGEDVNNVQRLFELESLGGIPRESELVKLAHSTHEARYSIENRSLNVRTANLPPNATVDPAIRPVDVRSWILDLDAFNEEQIKYERSMVSEEIKNLSMLGYDFFINSIGPDFNSRFGGE
jgi:uncharacterized protein (TIGR04255 family)